VRQRRAAFVVPRILLPAAALLVAGSVQAQASPCDALKTTLASRIEATGVRGFSLEAVPARTPVPPGAKVIGTCEGGATKILYRRWGTARIASGAASEATPASAPQAVVVPSEAPAVGRSNAAATASAAAAPANNTSSARASEPEAVRIVERPAAPPPPAPLDPPIEATASWARQAFDFMADHWPWIVALVVLLPAAAWLRAWRAHRNYYDEAGLPRGPSL